MMPPEDNIIAMPKLGLTMTDATLAEWIGVEGTHYDAGALIALIETDKISFEITAPNNGTLISIRVKAGEVAPIGATLANWQPDNATGANASAAAGESSVVEQPQPPIPQLPDQVRLEQANRIIATPLARRIAGQKNVDLAKIVGSGPRGRIKAIDVEQAAERMTTATLPATDRRNEIAPQSRIGRAMADRMIASKREIPHFYMTIEANVGELLSLRGKLNENCSSQKISLTHLLIMAIARCLCTHVSMRRLWTDEGIQTETRVDLGLAVDTERGLLSPVIRDLDNEDLFGIVRKAEEVIERARSGKLLPDDMGGGVMSISNAGMFGVRYVTPIIVPGQSAIVGLGAVTESYQRGPTGEPVACQTLGIVMSADHRVHTGADVARYLQALKRAIEQPLTFVIGSGRLP